MVSDMCLYISIATGKTEHEHCSQQYGRQTCVCIYQLLEVKRSMNTVHSSMVSDMCLYISIATGKTEHEHCSQQYGVRHVFIHINCYS